MEYFLGAAWEGDLEGCQLTQHHVDELSKVRMHRSAGLGSFGAFCNRLHEMVLWSEFCKLHSAHVCDLRKLRIVIAKLRIVIIHHQSLDCPVSF